MIEFVKQIKMYKSLESFKGKTNKIKYDIKRAYGKLDCGSCEPYSENHLRLKKMSRHKDLNLVQSAIDFHKFIPICYKDNKKKLLDYFTYLVCGFYEKNEKENSYDFYEMYLFDYLKECFNERKTIYLILDALNYGIEEENGKSEYVHHSLTVIFLPKKTRYYAYLINSHGLDTKNYTVYNRYKNIRKKNCEAIGWEFHNNYDYVMMKDFVDIFQMYTKIKIVYDKTSAHNYYGANLQNGDNYGVCCLFPAIFWYYFNKYYDKEVSLQNIKFGNAINMLKSKKLVAFIHLIFTEFDSKYENKLFNIMKNKDDVDEINDMVKNLNHRFLKKILNMTVAFLSQKYFV